MKCSCIVYCPPYLRSGDFLFTKKHTISKPFTRSQCWRTQIKPEINTVLVERVNSSWIKLNRCLGRHIGGWTFKDKNNRNKLEVAVKVYRVTIRVLLESQMFYIHCVCVCVMFSLVERWAAYHTVKREINSPETHARWMLAHNLLPQMCVCV